MQPGKNTSPGQGHTTNPNVAEVPATTGGTYPSPTTAAACDTHPLTDTLGNTTTRTPHIGTTTTHP